MAYCAICGTDHSPDSPCSCRMQDTLRNIGIGESKKPGKEFRELERKADRYMLKLFLIICGLILLAVVLRLLLE